MTSASRPGARVVVPPGDGAAVVEVIGSPPGVRGRSEEHTSELQSLMRISYAGFCLKKKKDKKMQLHNVKKFKDAKKEKRRKTNKIYNKLAIETSRTQNTKL